MLELDAGQPELVEGPLGDDGDHLAAHSAPTLPGSYPVTDLGGRMVAVDREYRAVRHQPAGRAVDRLQGSVRPVAPVGAPGTPSARRLDIDDRRGRIPPHHLG